MKQKKWNRYDILNAINNHYDLTGYEITSYEEATELYSDYLEPLRRVGPNFFNTVDSLIVFELIENWSDVSALNEKMIPLLKESEIPYFKERA